jgi:ribosomal protein S18
MENLKRQVSEELEKESKPKVRVTEKSVAQYLTRTKRVYKLMHEGKPMEGIEWLKDVDGIMKFVLEGGHWKTKNSQATIVNSITSFLRNSKDLPKDMEEVYKKYSSYNSTLANNNQKTKKENRMNGKESNVMIKWDEILEKMKDIKSLEDRALVSVYTLIPPRRVDDFRLMKVFVKKKGRIVPEDDHNYLVLNTKRVPQELVFNKYKTSKHYYQQVIKIPNELKEILKNYSDKGKVVGSCLFSQANGKCLSQPGFTSKVRNTFKKYCGKPLTVNSLRHSFISSLDQNKMSIADREEIARKMGHSVNEQMQYNRIDLGSDEEEKEKE